MARKQLNIIKLIEKKSIKSHRKQFIDGIGGQYKKGIIKIEKKM